MPQPNYLACKEDLLRGDIIHDVPLAYVGPGTYYLLKSIHSEHLKAGERLPEYALKDAQAIMRSVKLEELLVFTRSCIIENPDNYLGDREPVLCYRILRVNKDLQIPRIMAEHETVPCSALERCKNGELHGYFYLPPDEALSVNEGLVFFWEPIVAQQSELEVGRKIARLAPALMAEVVAAREEFDAIRPTDFEPDDPEEQVLAIRKALGINDVPYQGDLFGAPDDAGDVGDDGA